MNDAIDEKLEKLAATLLDGAIGGGKKPGEMVDIFKSVAVWRLGMKKLARGIEDDAEGASFASMRNKLTGKDPIQ